jgi:hypothetical protein
VQLMIDILAETPAALRLAAEFLTSHAALREMSEVPTGTQPAPFVPAAATPAAALAPTAVAAVAPTAPPAPAAPSNVLPFVPPVPVAPAAMVPAAPPAPGTSNAPSAVIPDTSASPTAPPAPISNVATVSPGASAAPPAAEEYDDHGVPYDGRIHQKGKSKKKDGSWKLQKGIADAVVSAVMQELASRIRKVQAAPPAPAPPAPAPDADTPVSVGASAPVTLPPVPPIPQAPLAPPAPGQIAAPPAPVETVAPALDPYRALIRKVTEARTAKRCTAEEVTQCAASAGVPSLQALNAMPHLIPTVEAHIDALLATR